MTDYSFLPEVVRLTLIIGVVVSMLVYERFQLTTGGAIVPAYLALSAADPLAIVVTLLLGLLTYQIVTVWGAKRWILYGRRKFEIEVLVGLGLLLATGALGGLLPADPVLVAGLSGVGFLIPGIIAHDMSRQKPGRTLGVIIASTIFLVILSATLETLLRAAPGTSLTLEVPGPSGYPPALLVVAVIVSVLVGMILFARLGLRSGGFITAAYLALVFPRWADLLFAVIVAGLTWFVVVRLLMPRLMIFGRRKLATMLLVGAVIGWTLEIAIVWATGGQYQPWSGLTIATLMVPALIANDAQRQGWERTGWGLTIATLATLGITNIIAAAAAYGGLL